MGLSVSFLWKLVLNLSHGTEDMELFGKGQRKDTLERRKEQIGEWTIIIRVTEYVLYAYHYTIPRPLSRSVVLNLGPFCLLKDICQCLETFLIVRAGDRGYYTDIYLEARDAVKRPTVHRVASPLLQQRIIQSQISIMPLLRNSDLDYLNSSL